MARCASLSAAAGTSTSAAAGTSTSASAASAPEPVELHYTPTPNGWKVTLLLEEADIPYTVHPVDLERGDQHTDEFRRLSPNGRMPVLVDPNAGGLAIFESGAIMLHLAERYPSARHLLGPPDDEAARSRVVQWLFWVNAGLGPMAGQASHFTYYAPRLDTAADHSYARRRYKDEFARLVGVMQRQLSATRFLAGEALSIADLAAWPWVKPWRRWMGCTLAEGGYPCVQRWYDAIKARPATMRGLAVLREQAIAGQRSREMGGISAEGIDKLFCQTQKREGAGATAAAPGAPASKL